MSKLKEFFSSLNSAYAAGFALLMSLIVGFSFGVFFMGLTAVPTTARENRLINLRQDFQIDTLKSVDREMDRKVERLLCLMTAQYDHSNPLVCSR